MGTLDGMTSPPRPRVVFDTNTVISALVFTTGRLTWLRWHWRESGCVPLTSQATVNELVRILAYSKFRLSAERSLQLQEDYLPYCQKIEIPDRCPVLCRDPKDQMFLDLAHRGKADLIVTGDDDLLALAGKTAFVIETPEAYRNRVSGADV